MTESRSTGAADLPRRPAGRPTLDLRYGEAAWTLRRLQAQVLHARRQLAATRAEVAAAARDRAAESSTATEPRFGAPLLAAQEEIAEGWAATARAAEAALDATEAEVLRIRAAVEAEAQVLAESAARLRTMPVPGAAPGNP
ncbi:MAG: hypothetical protein MUE36_11640 [Acidimicrobiales bacterium]|nr:hypothetical protein [Acidimicrobiales bacterium]